MVSGTLPESLANLNKLAHLSLDSTSMSGTLPSSLAAMTSLVTLIAHRNKLEGSMPSFRALHHLEYLSVFQNALQGHLDLPANTKLRVLLVHSNRYAILCL